MIYIKYILFVLTLFVILASIVDMKKDVNKKDYHTIVWIGFCLITFCWFTLYIYCHDLKRALVYFCSNIFAQVACMIEREGD